MAENKNQVPPPADAAPAKRDPKIFYLRAALDHPARQYRIQKHVITAQTGKFELNHDEQIELESKACKRWVTICTEKEYAVDKKKAKAWTKALKSDEV